MGLEAEQIGTVRQRRELAALLYDHEKDEEFVYERRTYSVSVGITEIAHEPLVRLDIWSPRLDAL